MERQENERMAKVETKVESMSATLERIEKKLDTQIAVYLPRAEADLRFERVEKDITDLKMNKRANITLAVSGLGVALTFLFSLLNYLK